MGAVRRIRWPLRRAAPFRADGRLCPSCCSPAATAACNFLTTEDDPRRPPDVFDKVRAIDLLPRFPQADRHHLDRPARRRAPATYLGTAARRAGPSPGVVGAQPAASGEGYELNFENTPVTGVAKVVLGDILQARLH